jgi:hypothetical protein
VSGAFDHVFNDHLLKTLQQLVYSTAIQFDGEQADVSPVWTGNPYRSAVSPIIFLLYFSPLFYKLTTNHPSSWIPSYIDNVAIVFKCKL